MKKSPYFPSSKSPGIFAIIHTLESTFGMFLEISKFAENRTEGQSLYQVKYNERIIGLSSEINSKMDYYGSDKGTFHGYSRIYSCILDELSDKGFRIAEIGIGTTNTKIPSDMGKKVYPELHFVLGMIYGVLKQYMDLMLIDKFWSIQIKSHLFTLINSIKKVGMN